ncbi:MAG: hypothetical protein ACREJR_06925, partial [Candidatus Rokuibacteriota bacterium]
TLKALEQAGRLDDESEAVVAMARGLAAAVDQDPGNPALWRELRQTLMSVAALGADRGPDDDTAAWLATIQAPGVRPKVGDAENPGP